MINKGFSKKMNMRNFRSLFIVIISLLQFIFSTALAAADGTSSEMDNPLLKYVPVNTLFFSGNTQLINLKDYPFFSLSQSFDLPLSQSERMIMGREFAFLYELYLDLENTALQGNSAIQTYYGLPEKIAVIFYSIGVSPVLKITIDDEQAFWNALNQAEEKSGFYHKEGVIENQAYRIYPMSEHHQLIASIDKREDGIKLATIAFMNNNLSKDHKELILGLTQPEQSIEHKINTIEKENQYLPMSVSFLDFRELARSLFATKSTEKNSIEGNSWVELLGGNDQFFAELHASNCEADILKLAQEMPQLVAGYKNYQLQGQRVIADFEVLLELKNDNIKTELKQFRGFIPNYIRQGAEDNILALGLGVNLSQITPFFMYLTKAVREVTFQCEQLKAMQKKISKVNPLMLAMVTGVVDGVHGLGFALQDVKVKNASDTNDTGTFEFSSLVSLSAENPMNVWQMMLAFMPDSAIIIPSETPQKLKIPELEAAGLDVYIALKGQHLVLYTGEQAKVMSSDLQNEKMLTNGFFQETINYSKIAKVIKKFRQNAISPLSPAMTEQQDLSAATCVYFDETIALLSRFSGFIDYQNDFVDEGWLNLINMDVELNSVLHSSYQLPGKYEIHNLKDGCQLAKEGLEEILADGTGFYQQYSDDGQCFTFETRYRWEQFREQIKQQYVSERSRSEGLCSNEFDSWSIPEPEYVNDTCQLRIETDGDFSCLYQWDGELNKSVYKRI